MNKCVHNFRPLQTQKLKIPIKRRRRDARGGGSRKPQHGGQRNTQQAGGGETYNRGERRKAQFAERYSYRGGAHLKRKVYLVISISRVGRQLKTGNLSPHPSPRKRKG